MPSRNNLSTPHQRLRLLKCQSCTYNGFRIRLMLKTSSDLFWNLLFLSSSWLHSCTIASTSSNTSQLKKNCSWKNRWKSWDFRLTCIGLHGSRSVCCFKSSSSPSSLECSKSLFRRKVDWRFSHIPTGWYFGCLCSFMQWLQSLIASCSRRFLTELTLQVSSGQFSGLSWSFRIIWWFKTTILSVSISSS